MQVDKTVSLGKIFKWTGLHMIWLLLYATAVATAYRLDLMDFMLPWLPISVIGTAVAFYVGFKNNQS